MLIFPYLGLDNIVEFLNQSGRSTKFYCVHYGIANQAGFATCTDVNQEHYYCDKSEDLYHAVDLVLIPESYRDFKERIEMRPMLIKKISEELGEPYDTRVKQLYEDWMLTYNALLRLGGIINSETRIVKVDAQTQIADIIPFHIELD